MLYNLLCLRLSLQEVIVGDDHLPGIHQSCPDASGVHCAADNIGREIFTVADDYGLAPFGELPEGAYRIDEIFQIVAETVDSCASVGEDFSIVRNELCRQIQVALSELSEQFRSSFIVLFLGFVGNFVQKVRDL